MSWLWLRLKDGGYVSVREGELFFTDVYRREWKVRPTAERDIPLRIELSRNEVEA